MRFAKIPETTFQEIQLNAGVLLNAFDAENLPTKDDLLAAIIGATSGGVNFSAVPTFSDFGDDIDNCPKNTKELKKLDTWDINMSGTYVTVNATLVADLLAAADNEDGKIIPRGDLQEEDFKDIWWVGDYSNKNDEATGGMIAIHMMNSLSTSGFSLKSGDKVKGQFSFGYSAHYSISEQDTVPFEVYVKAGT